MFMEGETGKVRKPYIPWGSNCVENGNGGWNIDSSPLGNFHFGEEDGCRHDNAVKEERDNMCYDLPNKEEAVDHINLLP